MSVGVAGRDATTGPVTSTCRSSRDGFTCPSSPDGNGNGTEWEESLVTGRESELNRRHDGNGIGNGNELIGMEGNGNVATHSRTSLLSAITH